MSKISALLSSRRFLLAVAGVAGILSEQLFGIKLTEDQILAVMTIVSAWVVGDSLRKTE